MIDFADSTFAGSDLGPEIPQLQGYAETFDTLLPIWGVEMIAELDEPTDRWEWRKDVCTLTLRYAGGRSTNYIRRKVKGADADAKLAEDVRRMEILRSHLLDEKRAFTYGTQSWNIPSLPAGFYPTGAPKLKGLGAVDIGSILAVEKHAEVTTDKDKTKTMRLNLPVDMVPRLKEVFLTIILRGDRNTAFIRHDLPFGSDVADYEATLNRLRLEMTAYALHRVRREQAA